MCNQLAAIGVKLSEEDKTMTLFNTLGSEYEYFTTSLLKPPIPVFDELISMLHTLQENRV